MIRSSYVQTPTVPGGKRADVFGYDTACPISTVLNIKSKAYAKHSSAEKEMLFGFMGANVALAGMETRKKQFPGPQSLTVDSTSFATWSFIFILQL